jgi:hypothetical protein
MGLSSLRRHRGGYLDRQLAGRAQTREELEAALADERAKTTALEAELAKARAKAAVPPPPPPPAAPPEPPPPDPEPAAPRRAPGRSK